MGDFKSFGGDRRVMFKSRFRGVYKCGKRWKAQLQSQGVQFYLGTFDTEEEAAKAYDRKARDEKGEKGQTNFDDNGEETISVNGHGDAAEEFAVSAQIDAPRYAKKMKVAVTNGVAVAVAVAPPSAAVFPVVPEILFGPEDSSIQVRMMWERLCQITQRMLLAKAALEKITELQFISPDQQKSELLKSLNDEISLLTLVTKQVEGAIVLSVSQGLTATAQTQQSSTDAAITDNQSSTYGVNDDVDKITHIGPGLPSKTGNGGIYGGTGLPGSEGDKDGGGDESPFVDKDQTERDHGLACTDNAYTYFDGVNDNCTNDALVSADCADNVSVRQNIDNDNSDDDGDGDDDDDEGEEEFNSPLRIEEEEAEANANVKNEEEGVSC